jgi:AcrR family transcriptional regulator
LTAPATIDGDDVAQQPAEGMGLRERKKLRTRMTIERVALELFGERGFQATTLAEIADAAEIAPSTLHAYFPSKDTILFELSDRIRESAASRIAARPDTESMVDTLQAWVSEDLPRVVDSDAEALRRRRAIIDGSDALLAQERLQIALLEDVLAEGFARDLGEGADDLRSRLMAAVAVTGLRAIWLWWFRHDRESREPHTLDATYFTSVIKAAETALAVIPSPSEHVAQSDQPAG